MATIDATVGGEDSNSYVTVAEADTYHADRGNSAWAALGSDAKIAALLNSCEYLEATYGEVWKGARVDTLQALSWPRDGVVVDGVELPFDEIPVNVQRAQMELAIKASSGTLLGDQEQAVKREKVDVIEVEYQSGSTATVLYPYVSRLLASLTRGAIGSANFTQARLQRV